MRNASGSAFRSGSGVKTNKTSYMAKGLFHVTSFPERSFQGLHPSPLSPGLVSPEADLCGESSRHHTSLFFVLSV